MRLSIAVSLIAVSGLWLTLSPHEGKSRAPHPDCRVTLSLSGLSGLARVSVQLGSADGGIGIERFQLGSAGLVLIEENLVPDGRDRP